MDKFFAQKYYNREDVQKAILDFAKNREIGVMFDGYFGKRPDVIEYISDVKSLVKKGVFSFHSSEERWANPLLLGDEKSDGERDNNRVGWDLILDLDGVDFIYSRYLAKVILDYFDEIGIKSATIKFSGNKGFHLGLPFECFSKDCTGLVSGISETRLLFPDVAKKTVMFLLHELKEKISQMILEKEGGGKEAITAISKRYGISESDLGYDEESNTFNFMKVIEIDTILISSRHLFRMPYSLHEKSSLVSVPIKKDKIMEFEKHWATPERVKPEWNKAFDFLSYDEKNGLDGNILLEKVYEDLDYISDEMYKDYEEKSRAKATDGILEINEEVGIKDFPESISHLLTLDLEDGRKRAVFLLLTFLTSIKWDVKVASDFVYDWNSRLSKPLRRNYLQAQISWFKARNKILSPPNFENDNYYFGLGIPKDVIKRDVNKFGKIKAKNPLHYVFLLLKNKNSRKK